MNIVGEVQVNGKKFLVVDPGASKYVGGVLVKYLLCNPAQFDTYSNSANKVEIVNEEVSQ